VSPSGRLRRSPPLPSLSPPRLVGWAFLAAAFSCGACNLDAPPPLDHTGPNLRVTRTYPAAGEGLNCTGDAECGVPTTASIELALDRYLLPRTAIRQSVRFHAAGSDRLLFLSPDYDPIERVVVYHPVAELLTDTVYTFEILVPDDTEDGDKNGLRAFDNAPVGESPVPLTISFRTRPVRGAAPPPPAPDPTCPEILEIMNRSCASSGCHAPCAQETGDMGIADCQQPAMGLELASATGWRTTAIGHVARETEIGPRSGVTLQNPSRFGVEMPIIDADRASNSYLMYKLLVNPHSYADANGQPLLATSSLRANEALRPPEAELERLRDWFIALDPMPPPGTNANDGSDADGHLDLESLRKIERWIDAGAPTHDCP
jgi:hypothetical protein